MNIKFVVLMIGVSLSTACTVEDSAFPSTSVAPKQTTYAIEMNREITAGSRTGGKREFRIELKRETAAGQFSAALTELLGMTNTSFFSMNSDSLTFDEFDTTKSAYSFTPPIDIARFPLAVSEGWDIDSKASWNDEFGQIHETRVTGTVKPTRVREVRVAKRSIRVMVLAFAVEVTAEIGARTPEQLGGTEITFTRVKNSYEGDLWFAPSYGLLVGGKYQESHSGEKASSNFEANTSWEITNLTK